MRFLQRLTGAKAPDAPDADGPETAKTAEPAEPDAEEREHDLDLARGEQARLDDLAQRQLRYSRYAWTPPAQGGERRAEDPPDSTDDH